MDEDYIYIRPQPKRSFQVEMHKMGTYDELRALREERDALNRERDGLRAALTALSEQHDAVVAAKRAGQQREAGLAVLVERLRGALQQYGEHLEGAGCHRGSLTCTCGLNAALAMPADLGGYGAALLQAARAVFIEDEARQKFAAVKGGGPVGDALEALARADEATKDAADALRAAGFTDQEGAK